jgi:hypothetical protein
MNLSPFSDDDIKIETTNDGLLKQITAIATDRTSEIIQTLAKVVYSPLLRAAAGTETKTFFVGEFDPFSYSQAAEVNHVLKSKFGGSCVEVELTPGLWSPGCSKGSLSTPRTRKYEREDVIADLVVPGPGIYYRRPIAHRVHIVERGQSRSITSQQLANAAPLLRLDIDRTAFVVRKTTVIFNAGAPTSVWVVKPSEALELVKFPLSVAAAIIDSQVEALTKRQALIDAESKYLQSLAAKEDSTTKYQNLLNQRIAVSGAPVTAVDPQAPRYAENQSRSAGDDSGTAAVLTFANIPPYFKARCAQLRLNDLECTAEFRKQSQ